MNMNREEAKAILKTLEPIFLTKAPKNANGRATYICPACGNGRGSSGDGIALDPTSKNGNRYKCFVCGINEDIIGLWKLSNNITDDKEAFNGLYSYFSLSVDSSVRPKAKNVFKPQYQSDNFDNPVYIDTYANINLDNMNYYKECMERVSQTDYFKNRGLSDLIMAKYMLGYDPYYNKTTGGREWQAAIIPTGNNSYVARNTDVKADKDNRYRKSGTSQLYLQKTLTEASSPIFVVEGEIDALSIIEAGGVAVGLGSTSNYRKFIEAVQSQKPVQPLILALDNDEEGEKTSKILENELNKLGIISYRCNFYGNVKDANEALITNRQGLTDKIIKAIREIKTAQAEELQAEKEEYLKTSTANHLQEFIDGIAGSVNTPYIPTGFTALDRVLEGGLYEGLYILGAISSLGKTTLALQIADQIADAGQDVLIFSLEMARSELMAKSISRLTLLDVLQNNGKINNAKTTRGITTGSRYRTYSHVEKELIQRAITAYGSYAKNIYIYEGIGDVGTDQIREKVKKHILFTGKEPTVVIDYVQILAPADIRATDKQNTDKAVLELKRLSRDFKLPVIGISSFNRANYSVAVSMEAFKESGSLEYGSDVLMGLQLKGAGSKNFDANEAKQKNPREVELVVLKNRNGATGKKLSFEYYPLFNYFKEV